MQIIAGHLVDGEQKIKREEELGYFKQPQQM